MEYWAAWPNVPENPDGLVEYDYDDRVPTLADTEMCPQMEREHEKAIDGREGTFAKQ